MEQTEEIQEPEEQEELHMTKVQRAISVLVTITLILTVMLCLYVVIQVLSNGYVNIGGYMMFRVVTGSMEPTIPVGALLITQEADIRAIQLDDIICFRTQETAIWGKIVTHRVVEILDMAGGEILLRTQGDANLIADGYLVSAGNFVGKVIWHTGNGSMLATIFSFFTNKIGFLGCIVFPCLLLAGLILKDTVTNIRAELQQAMIDLEEAEKAADWENDPLCGMTQEEYNEMYERLRAEIMEELKELMTSVQLSQNN